MINEWNEQESTRAERTWGHKRPRYIIDMFEFAKSNNTGYQDILDLGCGFGRFLNYLTENGSEPNWIGYDSSEAMINKIKTQYPEFSLRAFHRNITAPISHTPNVIISSAVLMHIPVADQLKVLKNILKVEPLPNAIVLDINSPKQAEIDRLKIKQTDHYERFITVTPGSKIKFRMTWQSHYSFTETILSLFPMYNLTIKFYDLKQGRKKVCYFLEKR